MLKNHVFYSTVEIYETVHYFNGLDSDVSENKFSRARKGFYFLLPSPWIFPEPSVIRRSTASVSSNFSDQNGELAATTGYFMAVCFSI